MSVFKRSLVNLRVGFQFASRLSSVGKHSEYLLISKTGTHENIGLIKINRPKTLNSLSSEVMKEISEAMDELENDSDIKVVIITGTEKVFAAGADIKEMCGQPYFKVYSMNFLARWDRVSTIRKPLIAAVHGYALGGGCELAMMCDIIYAAENAKFGQPEIKLGTIPGAGGTQRLIRAVGKSRAMEIILTGDMISAQEALTAGLISRIFPSQDVLPKSIELAEKIARFSSIATQAAKEAMNAAYNMTLTEGLHFEKRLFHSTFATNDCKEGMTAFTEKRQPNFTNS